METIKTRLWTFLLSSLFALSFLTVPTGCGNDGPNTDIDTEDIIQEALTIEYDAGLEILDDEEAGSEDDAED